MTTLDLVSAIEQKVHDRSLLKHAFYQAWSAGTLTKQELIGYAKEYYWAALHVPEVMEAIEKHFPADMDEGARATFAHNKEEEIEHIALWEKFASTLGVSKEELTSYEPTETVKDAVSSIVEAASEGFEEGMAAMYAFECDLPAISESKIDGLEKFYGLSSADARAYFEEHKAEEKHLCFWRAFLRKCPVERSTSILASAEKCVGAQNRVLDGVIERYCPTLTCGC